VAKLAPPERAVVLLLGIVFALFNDEFHSITVRSACVVINDSFGFAQSHR
jgi:hypothetical protein